MMRYLCAGALAFVVGCGAATPTQHAHDGSTDRHADDGHADEGMATARSEAAEKELYLTPKGKYTAADIAANGNTTAPRKFKGVRATHNVKSAVGDKLCPISLTKANPKFTWIVDGQSYEFCCPPCVDEFVQLAKEKPDELKPPTEFVKK